MLRLARYLPLLLLLGVAFAAGSASALSPPGELCRTVAYEASGDGPNPVLVLQAVRDDMIALDDEVHTLAPEGSPVSAPPVAGSGMADVCVYWLNICGPPVAAVLSKL
jgi:hypothetical protein